MLYACVKHFLFFSAAFFFCLALPLISYIILQHAYSDSLPSFQEPTEYSSRESEFFLQFLAEQIQSLRHSSGGSYSSRPTNFMPEVRN